MFMVYSLRRRQCECATPGKSLEYKIMTPEKEIAERLVLPQPPRVRLKRQTRQHVPGDLGKDFHGGILHA